MTRNSHSVRIYGVETSITLEQEFWEMFCDLARSRHITRTELIKDFWRTCPLGRSLASHIRISLLKMVQEKASA